MMSNKIVHITVQNTISNCERYKTKQTLTSTLQSNRHVPH
jgi:hypothetical protein